MLRVAWKGLAALLVAAGIAAAPSCAQNGGEQGDGGADVTQVGPCGPGTAVKCGDTCVDTQSNAQNCGSCGTACPSDQVCSHGQCAVVCGGGTSRCGNDCVDTKSDVNDCGGCGQKCPGGNVCSNGTCALTCQAGLTDCNGDCVDVNQNDDNCGACGQPCAGGQVCSNGKCIATCQSGWTSCPVGDAGATTCVDTQLDNAHCGGCNTPCPSGQVCSNGQCGLQCNGGTSLCGSACVDESIDPNNCGACTSTCAGNCSAGHCCAAGQIYCGGCDTVTNCISKSVGQIAAGSTHTCAVTSTGTLKCWGDDFNGELGDNNPGGNSNVAVDVLGLTGVTKVGAGIGYTCAVASSKGYCWGDPYHGELGDNDPNTELDQPSATPISLTTTAKSIDGSSSTGCALLTDGSVECWGYNLSGSVGDGSETERDAPVPVTLPKTAIAIDTGLGGTTCAALSDGTAMCWGDDSEGQCGDGTTTFLNQDSPIAVKNLTGIAAISVGSYHACALLTNGQVWCWGDDAYDQLGDGGNTDGYSVVPVQAQGVSGALAVAAGGDQTCALLQSGAVVCWGSNSSGELGDGTGTDSATPVTAISSGAVAIAAGEAHTCALLGTGKAMCWGANGDGELGNADPNFNDSNSPVQVVGF